MKVILLKDIAKVGRRFEVREVSGGYAQNMLIPKGMAVAATPHAVKRLAASKAAAESEREVSEDLMRKNMAGLEGVVLTVKCKASDKGHLFAGLHRKEIADEIFRQTRIEIDPSLIKLEHPIKAAGEYDIEAEAVGKPVKFRFAVEAES